MAITESQQQARKQREPIYHCPIRSLDPNPLNSWANPAGFLQMLRQCYGVRRMKLIRNDRGDWFEANTGRVVLVRR